MRSPTLVLLRAFCVSVVCLMLSGCASVTRLVNSADWETIARTAADWADLDSAAPAAPANTKPAATNAYDLSLRVTRLTADKVWFDWSPRVYDWPRKTVKREVDAIVELRLSDGTGGKFDWIRRNGQSVKEFSNLRNGNWKHRMPTNGEPVTFVWRSVDGKQRSNPAPAVWP